MNQTHYMKKNKRGKDEVTRFYSIKSRIPQPITAAGFFGGDGEIRTLEPLLTVTRFPIVRARPTTRHLHAFAQPCHYKIWSGQSQEQTYLPAPPADVSALLRHSPRLIREELPYTGSSLLISYEFCQAQAAGATLERSDAARRSPSVAKEDSVISSPTLMTAASS